jgi:hypothetical protein
MTSADAAWKYLTRTIPAWSVCFTVTVLVFSFLVQPFGAGEPGKRNGSATPWQLVLSAITIFLHVLSVMFPARVCFALGDVIRRMKETASVKDTPRKRRTYTARSKNGTQTYPSPLFVILLPAYKEDMGTLEQTLRVLASHPQARHSYHVGPPSLPIEKRHASLPCGGVCRRHVLSPCRSIWLWRRRKRSLM